MPDAKRTASNNSVGVWLKLNFRSHEKRFVPFLQGEYMFLNSHTLKQEMVSANGQIQPAFSESYKGNLGVGGDLGFEIRLTNALNLEILGGYHGIQITNDVDLDLPPYTGNNVQQPSNIDGTFFMQFSGGLKYYMGKRKKKRDF